MNSLDFVVIGAMKSGTTTLYEDLRQHPDVHLLDKESGLLSGTREGRSPAPRTLDRIERALSEAPASSLCGEVATTYAMLPQFPGVIEAASLLPRHPRVIYILREPVARIISHHHHDVSDGRLSVGVDEAVRTDNRLIDYTRYAEQIEPWIDLVGRDNVLLLKFEDYMSDRERGFSSVLSFLGLTPMTRPLSLVAHNQSDGKPVAVGHWRSIVRSGAYRRLVRPLVPESARRRISKSVLPAAPPRPAPPQQATIDLIRSELATDQERLASLTGGPWWPLDPVVKRVNE